MPALFVLLALMSCLGLAGEVFMLDREPAMPGPTTFNNMSPVVSQADRLFYLVGEGRVWPYRWVPPVLEGQEPFGAGISRVIPVALAASSRWVLLLAENGQDYQLWRETDGTWSRNAAGSFGARLSAVTGGHFSLNEGVGLFAQFQTGRIGYWQVGRDGLLPVWQSPEPLPGIQTARNADFDGDGRDELLIVGAAGSVSIARWRNGLWETIWSLPPWGQVLGFDIAQADSHPGLEAVIVTSQRRLFLIGAVLDSFAVKARLTTATIASHVAFVPQISGAVMAGDASGDLDLYLLNGDSWRREAHLSGGDRLAFLIGLGPEHVLAGSSTGSLRIVHFVPLGQTRVYLDDEEVKGSGLYWDDGEFFFSLEFLRRVLSISSRWDEKKATLTLTTTGKLSVAMQTNKAEASIDGRPWQLGRGIAMVNGAPFVPADLLRAVFLINVTYDPGSNWLILTSTSPGAA